MKKTSILYATLLLAFAAHAADTEHPSTRRPTNPPPSADLSYNLKVKQSGLSLNGVATVQWRAGDGKYSIAAESRAAIFGKVVENHSDGAIDDYGLAPVTFHEKRLRKDPYTTSFKRDTKTIAFTESDTTYPIIGGEQDRLSAQWQLAAIARATPDKFKPGSEFSMFVAGRRDAEAWNFKVIKIETIQIGTGEVSAVHLVKEPPAKSPGQQVDLWLAPSMDWYPVRVRFNDPDGDFVDQVLEKVVKK
ncbi:MULTISPECIES: DUF3108 domain-containing protein [unclassified Duganella]|jgi:hypothetical protein|uniref:DUF3108 domain-containing protein n=1 Tax=unclassified Duganella TaxID=2636909 RepID=UPI0008882D5F|nr:MULTISPECIES: DUF3108 domain-containing protein [unclassified Duganella]SDH17629.1 Protein of unknown function [Duganella sp. OV458]SDK32150.1 Protein of unknown function [Duganella sp. OV510]